MSTTCILCVTIPCTNHEKKDTNTNTHKPEVVSAISLTKTTARNEADPGVLQKFHTVEHVWSLTLRLYSHTHKSWTKSIRPSRKHKEHVTQTDLGFVDGTFRYGDTREGVHGSLHRVTADAWHCIQNLLGQFGFFSQGTQNGCSLLHKTKKEGWKKKGRDSSQYSWIVELDYTQLIGSKIPSLFCRNRGNIVEQLKTISMFSTKYRQKNWATGHLLKRCFT